MGALWPLTIRCMLPRCQADNSLVIPSDIGDVCDVFYVTLPTSNPTNMPSVMPTVVPTDDPTVEPTPDPTTNPTVLVVDEPTSATTDEPTKGPTVDKGGAMRMSTSAYVSYVVGFV